MIIVKMHDKDLPYLVWCNAGQYQLPDYAVAGINEVWLIVDDNCGRRLRSNPIGYWTALGAYSGSRPI
jgi:hypothetical protein